MSTNNIERTVVATVVQETSKATYNGWELMYNVQTVEGVVKSINVHGTKEGVTVSASRSENGYKQIGFTGQQDNDLAAAILDQFDQIAEGGAE